MPQQVARDDGLLVVLATAEEQEVVICRVKVGGQAHVIDLDLVTGLVEPVPQDLDIARVAVSIHEVLVEIRDFDGFAHGFAAFQCDTVF